MITAHTIVLRGKSMELRPLEREDFDALISLAADKRIWQHYALDGSDPETMREALHAALEARGSGREYPFVVQSTGGNAVLGSTRFLDVQPAHRKLEIGWTWLDPAAWGGPVNPECKLLLLTYCFENLGLTRVQLKTDERNLRSRQAIAKTGAVFEGILRNDMVRANGTLRNSAYYSIVADEWPEAKKGLERLVEERLVALRLA